MNLKSASAATTMVTLVAMICGCGASGGDPGQGGGATAMGDASTEGYANSVSAAASPSSVAPTRKRIVLREPTPSSAKASPTREIRSEGPTEAVAGEIWQWAIGRNAWTDPALQKYTAALGRSADTDIADQSDGFELTLDALGNVGAVTLFNNEESLGYAPSSSNYLAYRGRLPGGLSWAQTATTLGVKYGASNQEGGFGTAITFKYTTSDHLFELKIAFMAGHEEDLPGARIHWVKVTRYSG